MENKDDKLNIQWYPGHMAKAKKLMQENLNAVDVIIELLDARIPVSSKNPDLDSLRKTKPKVVLLNKADLADEAINALWVRHYETSGVSAILTDSKKGLNLDKLLPLLLAETREKIERQKARGRLFAPVRAMVVGIPNVGKSTLINRYAGRSAAKAEDRPGVTRGKQWIHIKKGLELLDMPGILWPKLSSEEIGLNLAFTGAINDQIYDIETLAARLIGALSDNYARLFASRYGDGVIGETPLETLINIALKRGYIIKGGRADTTRAAVCILDEFRSGTIGRVSLERPDTISSQEYR